MSQVSEIKCPNCGEWNKWTDKVDDKCKACGEYLEPGRFVRAEEIKKIKAANKKNEYFVMKDSDETIVQLYKLFLNSILWGSYYVVMLFFIFIAGMLLIVGLIAA